MRYPIGGVFSGKLTAPPHPSALRAATFSREGRREVAPFAEGAPQFARVHFTERQISPPMTQPDVVRASPDKLIVPE